MTTARSVPGLLVLLALTLVACDPGSSSKIDPVGADACSVALTSRANSFTIRLLYTCAGPNHTQCYNITQLQCGGADVPLTASLPVESCPGQAWCVDDCNAVTAPGAIWDTPAVLQRDACNTYTQQKQAAP